MVEAEKTFFTLRLDKHQDGYLLCNNRRKAVANN